MHGLTCLFPGDGTARDDFSRRDGAGAGGGGTALPVAEPQVRGRLHEQPELRGRVQDGGLPVGRVQVARHRAQVLLQAALLE